MAMPISGLPSPPVPRALLLLRDTARANGIPLKALRAYAAGQMQEAGMASDGGRGPRMSAYW